MSEFSNDELNELMEYDIVNDDEDVPKSYSYIKNKKTKENPFEDYFDEFGA